VITFTHLITINVGVQEGWANHSPSARSVYVISNVLAQLCQSEWSEALSNNDYLLTYKYK